MFYASEVTPAKNKQITTLTSVLCAEFDPSVPLGLSDRLDDFVTDYSMDTLRNCVHFAPSRLPSVGRLRPRSTSRDCALREHRSGEVACHCGAAAERETLVQDLIGARLLAAEGSTSGRVVACHA